MRKMKVAMIVNSNNFSGLEKVATEIMMDLSNQCEFIYVTKDGPVVNRVRDLGLHYYIVDNISTKSIKQFIKRWKPDILHAHDFTASTVCCLISGPNTICHLHNNPPWIKKINLYSLAYLFFGLRTSKLLIVSESVRNEFIFRKIIENKYIITGNPVSYQDVAKDRIANVVKEYDVCCTGRITQQKNPIRFIKIIEKLIATFPAMKACWIGDGELKDTCTKYIEDHSLSDHIKMIGYKKDPFYYMSRAKIFMLCSDYEGYGLAAYEALCLGLPCVVSNVGGLVNIVDGSCGFLCNEDADFVNGLKVLMEDEGAYKSLSAGAVLRAQLLDNKDEYMQRIYCIYQDVVGN